ncbi:MAG: DUF3795 domain-containing protein [Candidatus Cloacimonetes bacterium]|nr:DUF3795 domain-containing protein [Candidatus Cloacimonadota bacterium]
MERYAAYCGLYCGACTSMIIKDRADGVATALQMQLTTNDSPCGGCRSADMADCEFVKCNRDHGTESCAFCTEFPCPRIVSFKGEEWEHHQVVIDNLMRIKEIGIPAWIEEQKERWKCPSCGSRTAWYQQSCPACGEIITNYM